MNDIASIVRKLLHRYRLRQINKEYLEKYELIDSYGFMRLRCTMVGICCRNNLYEGFAYNYRYRDFLIGRNNCNIYAPKQYWAVGVLSNNY